MSNFLEDLEQEIGNETVEAVVVGDRGWSYNQPASDPVTWDDVKDELNYRYSDGYGAPECHAVYIWTPTKVIFVSTYDGSTSVTYVPRNPVTCTPGMPGGG